MPVSSSKVHCLAALSSAPRRRQYTVRVLGGRRCLRRCVRGEDGVAGAVFVPARHRVRGPCRTREPKTALLTVGGRRPVPVLKERPWPQDAPPPPERRPTHPAP